MNKEQKMVEEWHERFEVLVAKKPMMADYKTYSLRASLIQEELDEYKDAATMGTTIEVADALADLLYVVYGTAVSYGIDLEPIFAEVHRSNMSKGDPEVVRASNGKIPKSKNWTAPDLYPLIKAQIEMAKPEEKK